MLPNVNTIISKEVYLLPVTIVSLKATSQMASVSVRKQKKNRLGIRKICRILRVRIRWRSWWTSEGGEKSVQDSRREGMKIDWGRKSGSARIVNSLRKKRGF